MDDQGPTHVSDPGRPLNELRTTGLLWLVNRVVFHPRGYALALHFVKDDLTTCTGWSILGDGTEPWSMNYDPTDEERARYGALSEHELFAQVKALLP